MNENINISCVCEHGYDKGAFKKTIENNIFTIFGNISKANTIVLRYHGELIDNICYDQYDNNLYIKYFFDDDKTTVNSLPLAKCTKCIGENYCVLLDLDSHDKITFFFCTANELEKDNLMSFNLNISEDLLSDFIKKHSDTPTNNLPVLESKKDLKLKHIFTTIRNYILNLTSKINICP